MTSVHVIANPAAGRGRVRGILAEIRASFSDRATISETRSSGDEEKLARQAIGDGARIIVVAGGDGTCSRVASTILSDGAKCSLAVIPCGTGNDFAKTLGVEKYTPAQIVELVNRNQSARIDIGRADTNYFINSCGFGFVPSVLEATQRVHLLKGDAVYIYTALGQLLTYRGIGVSADMIADSSTRKVLMLTVSNGRFLGGAFRIAPRASVLDGQLDFGFFADSRLVDRVRVFAGALRGTHTAHPSVRTQRARAMTLRFSTPPMMEVDGELRRASSSKVEIECLPRALDVIAAPGFPL